MVNAVIDNRPSHNRRRIHKSVLLRSFVAVVGQTYSEAVFAVPTVVSSLQNEIQSDGNPRLVEWDI